MAESVASVAASEAASPAVYVHPVLRDTARENPDVHQAWYADNGYHLGPPAVAAAAAAQNQRLLGARAGLHIKGWIVTQGR